jgi:microcystin-dependent protein
MSEPTIGEIRMFGFPRTPDGWLACDGSLVSIAQYEILYTLLGTTFGGDGQSNFAVPDMRGRVPVHMGQGQGLSPYSLGQTGGTETVTLTAAHLPVHNHLMAANTAAGTLNTPGPTAVMAGLDPSQMYQASAASEASLKLTATAVAPSGGGQPHNNIAPTQCVNFCIAYAGLFPSR